MARNKSVFAVCMLLLALAGCSKAGGSRLSDDRLTITVQIAPDSLNPILSTTNVEAFLDDLMFAKLVTLNDKHEHVPDLAAVVPTLANGGISKDGLTITYHLRTNATWSDGQPVTSHDVKFTWQQIMNPNVNVVSRHGFDRVRSIDTPDDSTLVVHLTTVFPPFIDYFFGESDEPYDILPAHAFAGVTDFNHAPFNAEPDVTDGPYKFARWIRGDRIVLEANENYFGGAPKIKELDVKIIGDANTAVGQLRTGETQLVINPTGPSNRSLAGAPNITRLAVLAPAYEALMLNLAHPPLDDRVVRMALSTATDRAALARDNEYGDAPPGVADLSPFSWGYDPKLKAPAYDPGKARAMLEADGWKPGKDGIRVKDGKRLSLLFVFAQGSDISRNVVAEVQQMWKQIGVEVQAKSYPYAQLYAVAQDGGVFMGGKFDAGLYAWISGADPDDSSQWLSTMIPPNGNNVDRYVSPAMDAAQHQALSTFDPAVRKKAYARIQKLIVDDVPAIFIFYNPQRYAFTSQLQHFSPNGIGEAWNAAEWTFATP